MSPSLEGIEDDMPGQRCFLDMWAFQLENEMVTVHVGLAEGPRCACQSARAEIKVSRQGQRNFCVMTVLLSYLNVHPPADPPPSAHSHLLLSGSEEITISVIIVEMKVLELITGHHTSISMLIKKLIGNRLVWFLLHFPLPHCEIKTERKGNISTQNVEIFIYLALFVYMPEICSILMKRFVELYLLLTLPVSQYDIFHSQFK